MRLKSARLHGLIGVYSASGKNEIFIDFTKCRNDIILIIGKNGSGKTTIWEALQPIPLPSYKFKEKEPGFVELEYVHDDIEYIIRIDYPITNSRDRAQTRAFIRKRIGDNIIELNPNGNIGSYKSALFTEFNLDPNFVSLSELSSEDMGIVSKKPSERKKFVASILESIADYNDINKAASKRSSIFKSMINSITAKIDTIGNEENLKTQLKALENRLHRLEEERAKMIKLVSLSESKIHLTDPNGDIQKTYNEVSDELYFINQQLNAYNIYIKKIQDTFGTTSLDELTAMHKVLSDKFYTLTKDIESTNEYIRDLLASKEEDVKYIQLKTAKVNSLKPEYNFEYIKDAIQATKNNIRKCKDIFHKLNLSESNHITKDEFIYGINIMSDIKDAISVVKSMADEKTLELAISNVRFNDSEIGTHNLHEQGLRALKDRRVYVESEIVSYNHILDLTKDLSNRPSDCTIDTCPFIKTALENFNKEPQRNLNRLYKDLSIIDEQIKIETEYLTKSEIIIKVEQMISNILRNIKSSVSILNKFPTGKLLTDIDVFLENFNNVIIMNSLTDVKDSLQYANVFEQYTRYKEDLIKLESDYKVYENKFEIIEELNSEIQTISKKLSDTMYKIETYRDDIRIMEESKLEIDSKLKSLDNSIRILREVEVLKERQETSLNKLSTVTSNMETIKSEIEKINKLNFDIENLNKEIKPTTEERDKIVFSLKQLEEYLEELAIYDQKYSMIELIKKYSSPTKGGIQTLFMQLYMGKTISMANDLLSLLFDGKFELLPYIINETEFKIPCINKESNVYHDDISSCSSAEKAMISMMISFSLLHHSSTVYNILRLDEIDGALDQSNRSKFLFVLDKFMKELGVENCIMISHSSEMDMSNVDIIQLTPVDNSKVNGNIIFTYNDN